MTTKTGPGKSYRKGISLLEAVKRFDTEEKAEAWFVAQRWPEGVTCPFCASEKVSEVASRKPQPFRCRACRRHFSVKTGTLLHSSNLPLSKWAVAFYLYSTSLKGVSSMKLHRDLGISQKAAWYMGHRIRGMWDAAAEKFAGPVEADETYFGGKESNKHASKKLNAGRGTVGKSAVAGVKDRATGKVKAKTVVRTDAPTLQGFVHGNTEPTAMVYTDEARAYEGLRRGHEAVKHSAAEYVKGMAHTNGMESFWATMKRGHNGVYHHFSAKHLGPVRAGVRGAAQRAPDGHGRANGPDGHRGRRQAHDLRGADRPRRHPQPPDAVGATMTNAASLNRTLFVADNLPILRGMDSESIDLIATDPPFNKGVKAFEGIVTAGAGKKGAKVSYKDTWTWGDVQAEWTERIREDHPNLYAVIQAANAAGGEDIGAYLCWLGVRVLEMHRVLKPTGSLYLHIDHTAHAYVKAMLDAIFGRDNFRNEIVWRIGWVSGFKTQKRGWVRNHDTLLYYTKQPKGFTFNKEYIPYPKDYARRDGKAGQGKGIPIEDTWNCQQADQLHSINIMSFSKEKTGWPTQKPIALYERIIKASSNEGDTVLDPFAGCATTCIAAERLGREWVAIDIHQEAKTVVLDRLRKEARLPMSRGRWDRAITVKTRAPKRTDDGGPAAPELVLVSPRPREPRLTARELRAQLIRDDGMQCQGCGWVPHHEEYLEVDHRIPSSREGRDDIRNRVLLCSPCNGAKGNKLTLAELRERRIQEGRMVEKAWDAAWYARTGRFG